MKNLQKVVAKKAYQEIKKISNSNNMVSVESAINTALLKTFGLINLGLLKLAFERNSEKLLASYGYGGKSRNFELTKAIRNYNFDTYAIEAKKYLFSFIPERMKTCTMYKNLENSLN